MKYLSSIFFLIPSILLAQVGGRQGTEIRVGGGAGGAATNAVATVQKDGVAIVNGATVIDFTNAAGSTVTVSADGTRARIGIPSASGSVDPTNAVLVNIIATGASTNTYYTTNLATTYNLATAVSNVQNNTYVKLQAGTNSITPVIVMSNGFGGVNFIAKTNVVIDGGGQFTFSGRAAPGEIFYLSNCANITIRGVIFDGLVITNYTAAPTNRQWGIVSVLSCDNIVFEDCKFVNGHNFGFLDIATLTSHAVTTNLAIRRSYFYNCGSAYTNNPLAFDGAAIEIIEGVVEDCVIEACQRGIEFYDNDTSRVFNRGVARRNTIKNTLNYAIFALAHTNSDNLLLYDNIIINEQGFTRRGSNYMTDATGIYIGGGFRHKVFNNIIIGTNYAGMIFGGNGTRMDELSVKGNYVEGFDNGIISGAGAATYSYKAKFFDNTVRRSISPMQLGGLRNSAVLDNHVIDLTVAGVAGINMYASGGFLSTNVFLDGNSSIDTLGNMDYGYASGSGNSNIIFGINVSVGHTVGEIEGAVDGIGIVLRGHVGGSGFPEFTESVAHKETVYRDFSENFVSFGIGFYGPVWGITNATTTKLSFYNPDPSADNWTTPGNIGVADEVYGVGWNGSTNVPTKNAVYDKIETIIAGAGDANGTNARAFSKDGSLTNSSLYTTRFAQFNGFPVINTASGVVRFYGTNQYWFLNLNTNSLVVFDSPLSNTVYRLLVLRTNNSTLTWSNIPSTAWLSSFTEPARTNWTLFEFEVEKNTGITNAEARGSELELVAGTAITFSTNGNQLTIASTASGTPAGSTFQIQYNSNSAFASSPYLYAAPLIHQLVLSNNNPAGGSGITLKGDASKFLLLQTASPNNIQSDSSIALYMGGTSWYNVASNGLYFAKSNSTDVGEIHAPARSNVVNRLLALERFDFKGGTLGAGKVLTDVAGDGNYTPQTPSASASGTNFDSIVVTNQSFKEKGIIFGSTGTNVLNFQGKTYEGNDTNTVVDVLFVFSNSIGVAKKSLFLIGQTNGATNHTISFSAVGGATINHFDGTNGATAFTLYSNSVVIVEATVVTNLTGTNILVTWKQDSFWPQRGSLLYAAAGYSTSNYYAGGTMYLDYSTYTNHDSTGLNYTNLAVMTLPASVMTNIGDSVTVIWRGRFRASNNGTNQFIAGIGLQTNGFGDTGQITNRAGTTWEYKAEVTSMGPTNQLVFWEFKQGGASTLSGNFTNYDSINFANGIITNGVTNVIRLQHKGLGSGAVSNNYMRVFFGPGVLQ